MPLNYPCWISMSSVSIIILYCCCSIEYTVLSLTIFLPLFFPPCKMPPCQIFFYNILNILWNGNSVLLTILFHNLKYLGFMGIKFNMDHIIFFHSYPPFSETNGSDNPMSRRRTSISALVLLETRIIGTRRVVHLLMAGRASSHW